MRTPLSYALPLASVRLMSYFEVLRLAGGKGWISLRIGLKARHHDSFFLPETSMKFLSNNLHVCLLMG